MKNINKIRERNLMQILVDEGLIDHEQINHVKEEVVETGELLIDVVLKNDFVEEMELAKLLIKNYQLAFIYIDDYSINPTAIDIMDGAFARHNKMLPLDVFGKTLVIVTSGNIDEKIIKELEKATQKEVAILISLHTNIEKKLDEIYPEEEITTEVHSRMDELFGSN
jgi:hypothetical protein